MKNLNASFAWTLLSPTSLAPLLSTTLGLAALGCASPNVNAEVRSLSEAKPAIYAYESDANGFHTKNFFFDDGKEVIAFDSQFTPELARKSIEFIRSKTTNPITTLIITHPNPDKFNGISEFKKIGAKVIASRATAEAMPGVHAYKKYFFVEMAHLFTAETYPELGTIDETFESAQELRTANGVSLELRELAKPGISSNQTVAFIPSENALLVGDLVHHRTHAWLEGGIVNGKATPTLTGWIADLREIRRRYGKSGAVRVLGARGPEAELVPAVKEQITYLVKADRLVTLAVKAAKGTTIDYKELTKQFEAAFPGFGLSYLIEYGAYGLADSKR